MTIQVLKAMHGDAFILRCNKDGNEGVIVVDGGTTASYKINRKFLEELGTIDAMILTHVDSDHIGGLIQYVKHHATDNQFPIKHLVVTCAEDVPVETNTDISYTQGRNLTSLLRKITDSQPHFKWYKTVCEGTILQFPFADIEFVSPTERIMSKHIDKLEKGECCDVASARTTSDFNNTALEELAENATPVPSETTDLANLASLAFIVSDGTHKVLMLGDAFPQGIDKYLEQKGYSDANKLAVDYFKVSHHGSKYNISNSLLDKIECNKYIISTNGGNGNTYHPDRETIAKIVCHPARNKSEKVTLLFNYPLADITSKAGTLFTEEEMSSESWNFDYKDDIDILPE